MQGIVYQILSQGDESFHHISDYSPFYEADRTWDGDRVAEKYAGSHAALSSRIFNTHLRWEIMPKSAGGPDKPARCKYIYVYRDGKDACTSFYHHLSSQADSDPFEGTFDEFVNLWLQNKIPFGSWAGHLKSWIGAASDPNNNILVVRYEDMLADIEGAVVRISDFLGKNSDLPYLRSTILPHISIDYMRAHREQYDPVSVSWKDGFQFIRKGVAGDHKNSFTSEHDRRYDAMLQKEFSGGYDAFIERAAELSRK